MGKPHSIHCRGYRGTGHEFDDEACDCEASTLDRRAKPMTDEKHRRGIFLPRDFPEIVCLCGSTRFMDAFHATGWQLTLDGYIVLTVGVCKHAEDHGGEALGQDVADKLDEVAVCQVFSHVWLSGHRKWAGKPGMGAVWYYERTGDLTRQYARRPSRKHPCGQPRGLSGLGWAARAEVLPETTSAQLGRNTGSRPT